MPGTMISARRGPMPVTLRRPARLNPASFQKSLRTCAVEMRKRSISSRRDRGSRATAAATADAVADVPIARSHLAGPSRRTTLDSLSSMNSCIWCSCRGDGGSSLRKISRSRTAPSGFENPVCRPLSWLATISALPPPMSQISTLRSPCGQTLSTPR